MSDLRAHCDTAAICKAYKIAPSELQLAFPHLQPPSKDDGVTATAADDAETWQQQHPSQDPLLLAIIGRISIKI